MSIWYEEELAEHRAVVKAREAVVSYGRCVRLTTTHLRGNRQPHDNMNWMASLDNGPVGYGPTEADAVYALIIEIETRELEQAEEAEERARR